MSASYLPIRPGLFDAKHLKKMGMAVWLYGHLHGHVRFNGEGAGCTFPAKPYTHGEAAEALGVSRETVRAWFYTLVRGEYITAERQGNALKVTVLKYGKSGSDTPYPDPNSVVQPTGGCDVDTTRSVVEPTLSQIAIQQRTIEVQIPFTGDAPAPLNAVPKPNRYGEVIDAIRGRGLDYEPTPRDAKAVKDSTLAPALIAEVYEAIARGTWGREFNRDNLSVQHAIACFNAYRAARAQPVPPKRGPGRPETKAEYFRRRREEMRNASLSTSDRGGHLGDGEQPALPDYRHRRPAGGHLAAGAG